MRWNIEVEFKPYLGYERVVEKFLLFPTCIGNECRWLEKAKIKQRYEHASGEISMRYRDKEWLD